MHDAFFDSNFTPFNASISIAAAGWVSFFFYPFSFSYFFFFHLHCKEASCTGFERQRDVQRRTLHTISIVISINGLWDQSASKGGERAARELAQFIQGSPNRIVLPLFNTVLLCICIRMDYLIMLWYTRRNTDDVCCTIKTSFQRVEKHKTFSFRIFYYLHAKEGKFIEIFLLSYDFYRWIIR